MHAHTAGVDQPQAAIITYVYDDFTVDITVFARETSAAPLMAVPRSFTPAGIKAQVTWDWPSRV